MNKKTDRLPYLIKTTLLSLVFITLSVILGYFIGKTGVIDTLFVEIDVSPLVVIFSLFAALFSILAIHELGHLVAGLLQGFRFALYIVGPFGFKKETNQPIQFYWNNDISLYGGLAATLPVRETKDLAIRFSRVVIAGPFTSLAFTLLSGLLSYYTVTMFDLYLIVSCLGHFAIFLGTTIPNKSGFFFTDRKRWQRLNGSGVEKRSELALLHTTVKQSMDGNYANVNPDIVNQLKEDPDESVQLLGDYLLHLHYKDAGNEELSRISFENLKLRKDQVSANMWKMLGIDFSISI